MADQPGSHLGPLWELEDDFGGWARLPRLLRTYSILKIPEHVLEINSGPACPEFEIKIQLPKEATNNV